PPDHASSGSWRRRGRQDDDDLVDHAVNVREVLHHVLGRAALIVARHASAERDLTLAAAEEQPELARPRMAEKRRVDAGAEAAILRFDQGGGGDLKPLGGQRRPERRYRGGRIEPGGVE